MVSWTLASGAGACLLPRSIMPPRLPNFVTPDLLTSRLWEFGHKSKAASFLRFRFMPDGSIGNYDHQNERSWRLEDGVLHLIGASGNVTARFETAVQDLNLVRLQGYHIPKPDIKFYLIEQRDAWPRNPGTRSDLANEIREFGWEIGDHTYGLPGFIEKGLAKLYIGKYTSIAGGVKISFGDHRLDMVSTYPFEILKQYWKSVPTGISDHTTRGDVRIGNDVWIGTDALILSGVTVGDGAVIAAKCVVTKDVPPFALVAGIPGRVLRYRFSEAIISELLRLSWWDWPDEVVDSYLPLMMSGDIEGFLTAARLK